MVWSHVEPGLPSRWGAVTELGREAVTPAHLDAKDAFAVGVGRLIDDLTLEGDLDRVGRGRGEPVVGVEDRWLVEERPSLTVGVGELDLDPAGPGFVTDPADGVADQQHRRRHGGHGCHERRRSRRW